MKKIVLTTIALAAFSNFSFAASLNGQCAEGKYTATYTLDPNQVCSVEQSITINGISQDTTFSTTESGSLVTEFNEEDQVNGSIKMNCSTDNGTAQLSTSFGSSSGCVGGSVPIFEIPRPPYGRPYYGGYGQQGNYGQQYNNYSR
ncbi:hypothetical protein [Agarilytica rhodophyticola]|uniref:hypothetical protein n=1 Tax=Agarilytica rhodophyticola TaxID=1737490 RepID=UPI000B3486D6|nr:hypothetical protein [Agarilytica rhodophyticola]